MSGTSRSVRARHAALATVTAGVSWFAGGQAVAAAGPCTGTTAGATTRAACEAVTANGPARGARLITINRLARAAGLPGLSSATGVLSIADPGGAAAGQGYPGLPGIPQAAAATSGLPNPLAVPVRLPELPDVPALPAIPARPDAAADGSTQPVTQPVPDAAQSVPDAAQSARKKPGKTAKRAERAKAVPATPPTKTQNAPKAPETRPGKKDGAVARIAKDLIDTTVLP
ncbi:hypothetical protein ACFY05_17210 [Microtetraspora fusca]|uniref:Uncharacterized protein n=1 Tax=Microtetraspora fusca TaxID=1997 RepID=A0ABW6V8G2_MICFU